MKLLNGAEAVARMCSVSVKKVFLKFCKIRRKPPTVSFLNKVPGMASSISLKKRLCHGCFPVNLTKFFKATFL